MSLGATEPHAPTLAPNDRFGLRHAAYWLDRTIGLLTEGVGAVMLIVGTALAMARALTQSGFSQWLVSIMAGVPGGRAGFLAITSVAFIILGTVLEGVPAILLFGPLLLPVARPMGVHEVHYSIIVILAMGIGLFAPPFGVGFHGACAIGKISPEDALWRIWPYILRWSLH